MVGGKQRLAVGTGGGVHPAAEGDGFARAARQHAGGELLPGTGVAGGKDAGAALDLAVLGVLHHLLGHLKAGLPGGGLDHLAVAFPHAGLGIGAVLAHVLEIAQSGFAGVLLRKVAAGVHVEHLVDHGGPLKALHALLDHGPDRLLAFAIDAVVQAAALGKDNICHLVSSSFLCFSLRPLRAVPECGINALRAPRALPGPPLSFSSLRCMTGHLRAHRPSYKGRFTSQLLPRCPWKR